VPYENIVFIKLKIELLDDRRWQDLCTERQQLLYVKLLLLAGRLENMIPNDPRYLCRELNFPRYPNELSKDIAHLATVFPKLSVDSEWIQFLNFNELHNFRKSHKIKIGNPGIVPEKEKRREDKEKKETNIFADEFNALWNLYPSKDGKKASEKHFNATVKNKEDLIEIQQALNNYLNHLKINSWKKPKNGSTWFNNWRDWVNWQEPEKPSGNREFVGGNR